MDECEMYGDGATVEEERTIDRLTRLADAVVGCFVRTAPNKEALEKVDIIVLVTPRGSDCGGLSTTMKDFESVQAVLRSTANTIKLGRRRRTHGA